MENVFGIIAVGIFILAALRLAPRQGLWRRGGNYDAEGGDYDAGGGDPIEVPQPADDSPPAPPDIAWSYAGPDAPACPVPESGPAIPCDPPPP